MWGRVLDGWSFGDVVLCVRRFHGWYTIVLGLVFFLSWFLVRLCAFRFVYALMFDVS